MEPQLDLIAARATPDSISAIAVVRLSGRGALRTVERLMNLEPGRLNGMRRVLGDLAGIDKLVAISWPVGKSYTGEEMVDLMCHGSPGTAEAVLRELEANGARPALPGEFTRRAWINGRVSEMDVLQLSARFRKVESRGTALLEGKLDRLITETEALIEFGEEHEIADEDHVRSMLMDMKETIKDLCDRVARLEVLPRTYIMGPVNAGKSTLFNLLCRGKEALVSKVPGTTRDGARKTIEISGRQVEIADTAGTGGESLDTEALEIALQGIRPGDRVIWMDPDGTDPPDNISKEQPVIKLASKHDETDSEVETQDGWLPFSAITEEGLKTVEDFLTSSENESPSWRLSIALEVIDSAIEAWDAQDMALAMENVRQAAETINTPCPGSAAVERALEMFCVGK